MNDTPGRISPGSAPSDGHRSSDGPRSSGKPGPDQPGSGARPTGAGADSVATGPKWSQEQPPPAPWSAPSGPQGAVEQPPGQGRAEGTGQADGPGQVPPASSTPGGPGDLGGQGGHNGTGAAWGARPGGHGGPTAGPGAYRRPAGHGGPVGHGGPGGYVRPGGYPGGHAGGPVGGGYGAWGAGWAPPAAKPGVIPLRPLGVSEILEGAVSTLRAHWRTVLSISLAVAVVVQVVLDLLDRFVLNDSASADTLRNPDATNEELSRALGDSLLGSGAVLLVSLLGIAFATSLLAAVISRAVIGRPLTTRRTLQDAGPQLPKVLGLVFVLLLAAGLVVVVGAVPGLLLSALGPEGAPIAVLGSLAAIVLVVWLMVRLSLAFPALMLEKQGVRKAMTRSMKLVHGAWWRVFGIQLLAAVIALIVSVILVVPFTLLGNAWDGHSLSDFVETGGADAGWRFVIVSDIGSVLSSMLTLPITAGVTVLLYIDQRIRREALDLALARAAGLDGDGRQAAGGSDAGPDGVRRVGHEHGGNDQNGHAHGAADTAPGTAPGS